MATNPMSSPNSHPSFSQQVPPWVESPVLAASLNSNRSYQTGFPDDSASMVLDLVSDILEVSLRTFMHFLAPPQSDFDLEATMEMLKSAPGGILTPSGRLLAFEKEPKDQPGEEHIVFEPMTTISEKVICAIIANSNLSAADCLTDFLQNPSMAAMWSDRYYTARPNGYLLLKDRSDGAVSWADVVLSCEYQRKDGAEELNDNVQKCLWSMQHVMRNDPCRRATFGMTIENTMTRLWFCCRSSVIVSKPFNFIASPRLLVKFFAAFAFADKASLGFDPTIQRISEEPTQFIITVHPHDNSKPRKFRTRKIISSFGAEPLRGRGTRVFEAIEIGEDGAEKGPIVVLKDTWIDHDRSREGVILAQLYDEANQEDKNLVKKHFLTPVCHGDVRTELGALDDTQYGLLHGLELTPDSVFTLQESLHLALNTPNLGGSESLRHVNCFRLPDWNINYSYKTHYRIVFMEKGETLDRLTNLSQVVEILGGILTALEFLQRAGWVHRDVSLGNILSCNGTAKLADLEYAKKVGDTASDDIRTGTQGFMSIEVSMGHYLFGPPTNASLLDDAIRKCTEERVEMDHVPAVPFRHNHLSHGGG